MALSGQDEKHTLAARMPEFRRKRRLPPSKTKMAHHEIEAMKGVKYLDRKREKPAPWGYSR